MSALKALVPGLLLLGSLSPVARGDAIDNWSSWSDITPQAQSLYFVNLVTSDPSTWTNGARRADAYVNLSDGPFPAATPLTSSTAQPWYQSPTATKVFGHTPTVDERAKFTDNVLKAVGHTFALSKIPITLTTDPTIAASHTLSVVGNTSYGPNPSVIGMTFQGGDGLSYFDQFSAARDKNELTWLVAHNISHELMHAFGTHHFDTTGQYLDSGVTNWDTMTDPYARFSPAAVSDLLSKNFATRSLPLDYDGQSITGVPAGICPVCGGPAPDSHSGLRGAPVPEPASVALWLTVASGMVLTRRARPRRKLSA